MHCGEMEFGAIKNESYATKSKIFLQSLSGTEIPLSGKCVPLFAIFHCFSTKKRTREITVKVPLLTAKKSSECTDIYRQIASPMLT